MTLRLFVLRVAYAIGRRDHSERTVYCNPRWACRAGRDERRAAAWLRTWPVTEIRLGLFTTGLFRSLGQRDVEERLQRFLAERDTPLARIEQGLIPCRGLEQARIVRSI